MAEAETTAQPLPHETQISKTKKMEFRAEIDTSPPFGSVKEAVTRFGGSGFWIPLHLLREAHHGIEEFDISKVEQHAAELEKALTLKEQETLDVLKEVETTKRIIEELKLKLQKEASESMATPDFNMSTPDIKEMNEKNPKNVVSNHEKTMENLSLCPTSSLGLVLTELKQAKLHLGKTTNDLAVIRASVESLNKKVKKQETSLEMACKSPTSNSPGVPFPEEEPNLTKVKLQMTNDTETRRGFQNPTFISRELEQLNFEAEQFIRMAEAAKSELLRAMSGIEQTKTSMRTAEIRWVAAKKMEEAAKAVEAVALAEMKALSNSESSSGVFLQRPEGVTLSFEDYASLIPNARKAEGLSKKKVVDAMLQIDEANLSRLSMLKKFEETTKELKDSKKALEEALGRIEVANRRRLAAEEALRRWGPEHSQMKRPMPNTTKPKDSYPPHYHQNSRLFDMSRSNQVNDESKPVLRPTFSIGEILSRTSILPEEFVAVKRMEGRADGQKVSLSQMLHEQRSIPSTPTRGDKDGSDQKLFFAKNKKFGFIHLSLPLTKQRHTKMQASKLR
ncbi:hypothetical protein L1049_011969 [Liquidambar formosana]|uniref:WEB family protein n=1 Tax=Liquidambar formosana TaxID=63359 RepID=A0AAP0WXE1_LIQFO